jgi:hypothetical protein
MYTSAECRAQAEQKLTAHARRCFGQNQAANRGGLFRFWPHYYIFGFLPAVASVDAFVQVYEVARWPREDQAHAIATAGGAGPGNRGFASGRVGLVRMRHGPYLHAWPKFRPN